jgi:hypothetical protein
MIGQDIGSMSSHADPTVGIIAWNAVKKKYDLIAKDEIIVSSKDKGYLNYLVVKQKHTAILNAGLKSTKLLVSETPCENLGISQFIMEGIAAEMQPFVDAGIKPEFTRPRGRPRKYHPQIENKRSHTLSDSEREIRTLMPITKHKIVLDFKEYLEENFTPKKALEEICNLYNITYFQAFGICESHM